MSNSDSDGDEDSGAFDDLLNSTSGILQARDTRSRVLPQGTLAVERLRDANQAAKCEGAVHSVRFHPSPAIPVLLVAGADRRARIFNVSFIRTLATEMS